MMNKTLEFVPPLLRLYMTKKNRQEWYTFKVWIYILVRAAKTPCKWGMVTSRDIKFGALKYILTCLPFRRNCNYTAIAFHYDVIKNE